MWKKKIEYIEVQKPGTYTDDGTPSSLPEWAKDELVERRVRMMDLHQENLELKLKLAKCLGEDEMAVLFHSLKNPPY